MVFKETLKAVIAFQKEELQTKEIGIEREKLAEIDLKVPHAIIISGIRRCGKSTLLRQLMKKTKIFSYCNFEDPRLGNILFEDIEKLSQVFHELNGDTEYYFFDEVQNLPQWERYIRFLLDKGKKCIISGSNASLLSKELGTKLTGRHLTYELFPFSYNEMLNFTKQKQGGESSEEYREQGGFPEFLRYKNIDILQELMKDVLSRDIIIRYKLRYVASIEALLQYLITNIGKEFSYNKLAKLFHHGSPSSTIEYISYFEDSYLLFTLSKFDYSYKKQQINPKKVYSIDTGFARANAVSFSQDYGPMLENLIFLHLRRRYKHIFYFRQQQECDFVVKEKEKIIFAVQVCYELTEENKEREISGLREAMEHCKCKQGVIITNNQEDRINNIRIIPAWKFLTETFNSI